MSKSDAIAAAIATELRRRSALIDTSAHLSSVTLTVKLQDGPDPIRSVTYEDQQILARNRRLSDT